MHMEFRVFKHDYLNILMSLNAYIEEERLEELKVYYQTKILPTGTNLKEKDLVLSNFTNLKVLEIKGLLYMKTMHALNEEIQFSLDIKEPIVKIDMDGLDLARVLGVFMDNAIEETLEAERKEIAVRIARKDSRTIIGIYNSCRTEQMNVTSIYEAGNSTKGERRGMGLFSARELIRRYPNVVHITTCENYIFVQKLEIGKRNETKHLIGKRCLV
jgi:two-component system, LytTR family, sensor histidine kinase AgrC